MNQLVEVVHLAGQVKDIFKRHIDRDVGGETLKIGWCRTVVSGSSHYQDRIGFGNDHQGMWCCTPLREE